MLESTGQAEVFYRVRIPKLLMKKNLKLNYTVVLINAINIRLWRTRKANPTGQNEQNTMAYSTYVLNKFKASSSSSELDTKKEEMNQNIKADSMYTKDKATASCSIIEQDTKGLMTKPIKKLNRGTASCSIIEQDTKGGETELNKIYKKGFVASYDNALKYTKKITLDKEMKFVGKGKKMRATQMILPEFDLVWGRPGIYMLVNNITKKRYIGKSINLYERFMDYRLTDNNENWWHRVYPFKDDNRKKTKICRYIMKFGLDKFSIHILEHCKLEDLNKREQYFITHMKPQINVRKSTHKEEG